MFLGTKGYRGDNCAHNANICKKGLVCDPDKLTCQYKHKCGNKFRGKKGNDCKKNSDCCKKDDLICNNKDECDKKDNN